MVAIIGVLAAVAIPAYNGYRNSAAENAAQSQASEITKAIQACATINQYSTCIGSSATETVNMTLSTECKGNASAGGAGECNVGFKSSTSKACASAQVQGVGKVYKSCFDIDTSNGQVSDAGDKYCHGMNGVCT